MTDIGGQAVVNGVMMRNKKEYVVAVRKEDKIKVKKDKIKVSKISKFPFLRGVVSLAEFLVIGIKALEWSAKQAADEDEPVSNTEIALTFIIAFGLSLLLFVGIPFFVSGLVVSKNNVWFNLFEGLIRVLIFISYIFIISKFKDVREVFEYHGAEHKTINCHEAGKKLTVKNVKKFPTLHARCGTSFIMIVLIVSIVVFSFILDPRWYMKLISRIVLIPVISGISYEILKLSAKFEELGFVKMIVAPGLWLQRLTTKEPNNKQTEVAIRAFKELLKS
ncbi:MAG: hypothetical protein MAG795_00610 [Candidatus Woesearchaeota archaeon]|nr:hypothetical protein [Candidatus Woesearchaeota archaeon]